MRGLISYRTVQYKKMIHKIRAELLLWWEDFCYNAPGRIGQKLRKVLFLRKSKMQIHHVNICAGVYVDGWENFSFSNNLSLGRGCIIETSSGILKMGKNISFNSGVVVSANEGEVFIGDDVIIGMNTVVRAAGHSFDDSPNILIREQGHDGGKVQIGKDVWIGANVSILPNTTIGDHCIIGAGAVVTGAIPSYSVAVGVPAKVIKKIVN